MYRVPVSAAHRPRGTGTIVETLDAAALREVIPEWESLAAEAAEPNPFYEHWMLLPALEAYGARSLRTLAVWDSGTLIGLFPMDAQRSFRGLPVRSYGCWRHRNMLLWGMPLVRAKAAAKCLAALLQSGQAPLFEFDWISAGGAFYGALIEALMETKAAWTVTDAYTRAVLLRDRDPRERFNSNMKNNVRRWQAKLAAYGKVTPVRLQPGDDVAPWTEEFIKLEASGWKGRAGSAIACRAEDRRFTEQVFAEAHRRGRLVITGLDLNGRPLARHCMLAGGDGAFTYKIAYDETYEKCSPGIVGEVDNVRQFIETPGPRWIDSNTARENTSYGRAWKDRITVQRVAVGTSFAGRLALASLPLARYLARRVGLKRRRKPRAAQNAPRLPSNDLRQVA